ncbi:MAG: glycosyltransferase [Bacteroidota bacterium]
MISSVKSAMRASATFIRHWQKKRIRQKILNKKTKRAQHHYDPTPEITFVIQFFNKKQNVNQIFRAIQPFEHAEIIVIDDGSIDGSHKEWMRLLTKPNHFLLHSNDLHEVITYDRALRMAKGKFACLLQDDDFPIGEKWVTEALNLLNNYPTMIILGGKSGLEVKLPDEPKHKNDNEYSITENIASAPGITKYRLFSDPIYLCPRTNVPFMFCSAINRAPMFVNTQAYLKLGGTDLSFAPFQCDDFDICLRAWKSGYKVGFYHANFRRNINIGGMRLFNAEIVSGQAAKNWKKIYQIHSHFIAEEVHQLVKAANSSLDKIEGHIS